MKITDAVQDNNSNVKTLIVTLEFDKDDKGVVSRVTNALSEFEISSVSWKQPEQKPAFTHRTASTLRGAQSDQ